MSESSEPLDLTRNVAFTHHLMDDAWAWRHRLVEELTLGRGEHVRVTSSYHVGLSSSIVREFADLRSARTVRALLPLTMRPKRPLLRFDLVGADGAPATLILRSAISSVQSTYLEALARTGPAGERLTSRLDADLLRAVCDFTPDIFKSFEAEHRRVRHRLVGGHRHAVETYRAYLTDGLGLDIGRTDVERWMSKQAEVAEVIVEALDEPSDPYSSTERALLALPRLVELPPAVSTIDDLLDRYVDAVRVASDEEDLSFLRVLGDYGKRWEVLVETEIPLDRAVTVKLLEDRPLRDPAGSRWRLNELAHVLPLGEARSAHLEVHLSGHRVSIASFDVHELSRERRPVRIPHWEGVRHTEEFLSLYSAQADRPYYVTLHASLRPAAHVRWPAWLILGLAGAATLLAAFIRPDDVNDHLVLLTLLTFPTTFAVALLLLRESTGLAVRLQRRTRKLTAVVTAALWVVVFAQLSTVLPVSWS